jgi:hypothetical protein
MEILELQKFKAAEVGVCTTWHGEQLVERLVYDAIGMIRILIDEDSMGEQEAAEYIEREFVFKYAGDTQPIVLWKNFDDNEDS